LSTRSVVRASQREDAGGSRTRVRSAVGEQRPPLGQCLECRRLPASSSSPGCRSWRRRRHVRKLISHNLLHRHLVSSPSRIILASVVRRPVRFGACPLMNLCGNGTATRPESGHRSLSFPTPDSGRRSGVTDRGVDPEFCDYDTDIQF